MEAASSIDVREKPAPIGEMWSRGIEEDPRWQLTKRVIAGRHFARSPLLSKFLLYIVEETLERRQGEISEHQIGVHVFGRPSSYRTVEDNIVRNYARQLRKRLAEHFADDEKENTRIEIPLGGYVPVFTPRRDELLRRPSPGEDFQSSPSLPVAIAPKPDAASRPRPWRSRRLLTGAMLAAYSAVLICLTWVVAAHMLVPHHEDGPGQILWQTLLNGARTTYIVPPDAGFNLVEDLSHHPVPLAEYLQGAYLALPLAHFDNHSADDLRMHQFTDFVNLQIVAALSRLPEYNPQRVSLRFPRDLRLDDLKNSNALIIGSVCSNPWAAIADAKASFTIVCREGMEGSTIINRRQQPGEQPFYASHWNEPTHETYALVSFFPNLNGKGHLLLLQGLDVAGTQAAAEAVLETDAIAQVLKRAMRPDGTLGSFEVLLRSTSIQSNATDTQVIASRID